MIRSNSNEGLTECAPASEHTRPRADELPGPAPLLPGGGANLLRFLSNPVGFMERLRTRYGDVVSLTRGRSDYVFAFGAEHNRQILGDTSLFHNLDASSLPIRVPPHSALSRLFTGLIQMNGPRHEQQRRLMATAFTRSATASLFDDVVRVTKRQIDTWRIGERRDMAHEMSELTLSIAVRVLLGLDPSVAGESLRRLLWHWTRLVFSRMTLLLPFDLPGLPYRRLRIVSECLETELQKVIAAKRAQGDSSPSILSSLLAAHDDDSGALTNAEIVGQTNFLFMAGHATTANALAWILFLLDRHPQAYEALRSECAELRGRVPTFEDLQQMPFLDAVIKEGVRLLPPVIWWCRISTAPFRLDRFVLPAGTRVIQSAYVTHRDAALYPDPYKFVPQRWMHARRDAYQYCPFSAGPRMCLGAGLAIMEIKIVIALMLQRFRATLPALSRIDLCGPMILTPKSGMIMELQNPSATSAPMPITGNIHAAVQLA
jgi:cytochrome P450